MKMEWFVLGIGAMITFTLVFLLVKKIGDLGVRSDVLLLYYFAIAALVLLVYTLSTKVGLSVTKNVLILLVILGVLGAVANIFLIQSIKISPNPGFSLAVSGLHILLVAIASVFIFKSEFTLIKALGTILAVIGIILLGL